MVEASLFEMCTVDESAKTKTKTKNTTAVTTATLCDEYIDFLKFNRNLIFHDCFIIYANVRLLNMCFFSFLLFLTTLTLFVLLSGLELVENGASHNL